ncbi:hypothetical protein [Bradyrhizobium liaoningense]|uniref:hypothetical protein n=1 Tax=Bradyrhizobium liaoningense TaxID=43992 RepID=UPI001BA578DC|nr:hypothetical protein [Bradyrhizobium liaoningense]MBR0823532.1 hypothetical protein [Bradyrhizobium liaoningense]
MRLWSWPLVAGSIAVAALYLLGFQHWAPFDQMLRNLGDISDDLAFSLAQPALFQQGAQWGPEVVFTYGPLGFLASWPIFPALIKPAMVYCAVFALVASALLLSVVWRYVGQPRSRALAVLLLLANVYVWSIGWDEAMWVAPALCVGLLAITSDGKGGRWLLALLYVSTAVLGAAALVKFSLTILYVGIYGLIGLRDLLRRRLPSLSLAFAAAFVMAWLAAGQAIENLPVWLAACADLSVGYSDAMAKGFWYPYRPLTVALAYGAAIALVIVPLCARERWTERLFLAVLAAGVAMVNIKHAFGGNQIEQSVIMIAIAALLFGFCGAAWSRRVSAASIGACIAVLSLTNFHPRHVLRDHAISMAGALAGDYDFRAEGTEHFFKQVRQMAALPDWMSGTADIYPRKTGVVLAYPALVYDPRPAYLSLNAHTQRLAEQNAAFLRSDRAPRWILFEIKPEESVNHRYLATDDGPSWPEIWSRYDLKSVGPFLVYERRSAPLPFEFRPFRSDAIRFGQMIELDPSAYIWMWVDVRPTVLGRLVGAIYKAPQVLMNIIYEDGVPATYQIVPELGRAGFLLSPSTTSAAEFASMSGRKVRTIRMSVEGDIDWFYRPDMSLTLSTLEILYPR